MLLLSNSSPSTALFPRRHVLKNSLFQNSPGVAGGTLAMQFCMQGKEGPLAAVCPGLHGSSFV